MPALQKRNETEPKDWIDLISSEKCQEIELSRPSKYPKKHGRSIYI